MIGSVVITGGGTGGHLKVADAFIEELYNRGIGIIFIGSLNGQDKAWFENDKRLKKAIFLDTRGVVNKNSFGKVTSLLNIFSKTIYCLNLYSKYNIKMVISVGGFSAAAATFASILKFGCKLYIHEQNSKMGKLNEIPSKFATEVFSSFDENSLVKDYPVSSEFFNFLISIVIILILIVKNLKPTKTHLQSILLLIAKIFLILQAMRLSLA